MRNGPVGGRAISHPDARPGRCRIPDPGVFLEIVAPERLVFTDAFTPGWIPSGKPFMSAQVTLEEREGKTLYTARAMHWSEEDRQAHESMGFHDGWGQSLDRLVKLVTEGMPD
nr:SRPBCC domain-containing protein [Pseudomonas sp. TH10]